MIPMRAVINGIIFINLCTAVETAIHHGAPAPLGADLVRSSRICVVRTYVVASSSPGFQFVKPNRR